MALPLNETTEQPCAAGLERINGQCVPVSATTNTNALETSSFSTVTMIMPTESAVTQTLPKMNACPPGTERAENGQCQPIQLWTSTETLLQSSSLPTTATIAPELTTTAVSGKVGKMEDCPQGTVRGSNGECQPVEVSTTTQVLLETSSLSTDTTLTTEKTMPATESMLTTEVNTVAETTEAGQLEACPPNTLRAKNGQCEPVDSMTTTQAAEVEKTTEASAMSGKPVNLMRCPEGTKRDDDGACQEIVPTTPKKTTDPRLFLKQDGSCPDDYKRVEGQCLYIGSKVNATLDRVQPKSGTDEHSNLNQLVRKNDDGSCPTGTQYYENGLCMVINQHLTPAVGNSKVTCGDAYELVNGKCIRKGFHQSEVSAKSMSVTTEQAETDENVVDPTVKTATSENDLNEDKPKKVQKIKTVPL